MIKKIFILSLVCWCSIFPVNVGSETSVSKQERVFFPQEDTDNTITGFTVISRGITLEDLNTTCTYDAFFPVSGDIVLNGGSLVLNQNIEFKSPLQISPGIIQGQKLSILFPDNLSILGLPAEKHDRLVNLQDLVMQDAAINSLTWSWDDLYVAIGTALSLNDPEIKVYYCAEQSLTLTASYEVSFGVNSIAFSPESYFLAIARDGVDAVQTLSFDPLANQISLIDTFTSINAGVAVDWHPDGTHVAVTNQGSTTVSIFSIVDGVIGSSITGTLPLGSLPSSDAIKWHPSGLYLAVGLQNNALGAEVVVFQYNGSTLTAAGSVEIGGAVNALDWRGDSLMLTIGHAATADRLLTFLYDPVDETLIEVESMQTGLQFEVFSVDWDEAGNDLTVGIIATANDNELITFRYDADEQKLDRVAGYSLGNTVNSAKFTHASVEKIAAGDTANLSLFSYDQNFATGYALTFQDAKIFFKSDVQINSSILLKGSCIMNGGNNALDLNMTGSLVIDTGASLILENMTVEGISGENIRCLNNNAQLTLRDVVWNQSDYSLFATGAFNAKENVTFKGSNIFAYTASQPFTIFKDARFTLDQECTFSYAPTNEAQNLFQFQDVTSQCILNGSTLFSIATGLQLTKGEIRVINDSSLASDIVGGVDEGIVFGDGNSSTNDVAVTILPGIEINVEKGALTVDNVDDVKISLLNPLSAIRMKENTTLRLKQNLNIGSGTVSFESNTQLARVPGKTIIGPIRVLGPLATVSI